MFLVMLLIKMNWPIWVIKVSSVEHNGICRMGSTFSHKPVKIGIARKILGFYESMSNKSKKKDIFKKLSIWLHCSFHLLRNRTCPTLWMQPRSQISWAFIPCVIVTGTSRPPAPPVGMACTKGSTGSPTSSKTLNDPFHPLLFCQRCVYECVWRLTALVSVLFIHFFLLSSLVYVRDSAQCCL